MATFTLDDHDARLLDDALGRGITLCGRLSATVYLVSSSRPDRVPHRVVVNRSGRMACDCEANTHGNRCTHIAYLNAFLRWHAARGGAA